MDDEFDDGDEGTMERPQRQWNHYLSCWDDEVEDMIDLGERLADLHDSTPGLDAFRSCGG